jgi:hypothetical protein
MQHISGKGALLQNMCCRVIGHVGNEVDYDAENIFQVWS